MDAPNVLSLALTRLSEDWPHPAVFLAHEIARWPATALEEFKKNCLLEPMQRATGLICPHCESRCWRPVHSIAEAAPESDVVVTTCEIRDDVDDFAHPASSLDRWCMTPDGLSKFVVGQIGITGSRRVLRNGSIALGIMRRGKTICSLLLDCEGGELELRSAGAAIGLSDVLVWQQDQVSIDHDAIRRLARQRTGGRVRPYRPNSSRREEANAQTASRDIEILRVARQHLRKHRNSQPRLTQRMVAQRIHKTPLGKDISVERIMKIITGKI